MKANRLSGLLLLLILIATAFRLSARAAEPEYNGKALSEWLLILKLGYTSAGQRAEASDAREAIRQMDTNAIPTLLHILGATDRNKWWVLSRLKSKGFRKMYHNQNVPTDDLQDTGVEAFGILGTNAVSAIPQINKLFGDWETCSPAARVLAGLGPEGMAALTNGLASKIDVIRGVTIWAIGEKSSMDSNTIARIMIASLKDPDVGNRDEAVRYLGGKDPAVAIPVLLPLLEDNKNYSYESVARALSSYGAAAKVAVPKLLSLYTNAVVQKNRDAAKGQCLELMWALKGIDMEAAAEAEAFLANSGPLGASYGYTTTPLPNGKELLVGGFLPTTTPTQTNHVLSSAELFNPVTGKWTETASMNVARYGHTATLLHNGKVLVTGGSDLVAGRVHDLCSAELYDPSTGQWTLTGSMNSPHPNEQAVLQHDGKVRVSGWVGDYQKRADDDLYDPATGTWTVVTKK
jgi:hypothetical protein